ncbi:MAG: aminotransferase class III-fold pyridoxal phosphate-dependent enzyme, partial [Alphaproteobacteria bacterium]|nr:aminotransferase class III-fold pyridoxal phosphate-dependent enzyme [Alphaproteobacteria bacterium]
MKQELLIERARAVLPAGGLGNLDPGIVIQRGEGARVWDEDGNEYIDYLLGSGPMFLGHGHAEVVEAVQEQIGQGTTFFASNARAIELAEAITEAVACAEQVRYVSTGTEADMYAMRLARAFTGRNRIARFRTHFHGWHDHMAFGVSGHFDGTPSPGVLPEVAAQVVLLDPNDIDGVAQALEADGDIAAVILEPTGGGGGMMPLAPDFLPRLREITAEHGALLILDEVVTGFRVHPGGAQGLYGITP